MATYEAGFYLYPAFSGIDGSFYKLFKETGKSLKNEKK
jgi:hypothetical protein